MRLGDHEHHGGSHMRAVLRQAGVGLVVAVAVMMACAEGVLGPNLSGDLSAATPIIDLGTLGGSYSNALGVNNRGVSGGDRHLWPL